MLIRTPDYYDQFHCLAGACPHSCCEKWEIVIDDAHIRQYKTVSGALGEKLQTAMVQDEDGDTCFSLHGGRCPFLDSENLCEIHRHLGEKSTSITCQEHPRFTEDYGAFREITLSASCPAANALLLGSEAPLRFAERMTHEPEEPGDPWLNWLVPLRDTMLELLGNRTLPLRQRLYQLLLLALDAQTCLDTEEIDAISDLIKGCKALPPIDTTPHIPMFPHVFRILEQLEILEQDWPALLHEAEAASTLPVSERLLERIAVYLVFRYLLKCVNDGDLLGRTQFAVLGVLVIERLSAVCGLAEALRRFSCEIEHSEENLTALLNAFWQEPALSLPAMLTELSR